MGDTNDDISLLAALKGAKFEASLVTTFNATLPFYEEVVLRRLQAAESRHNVVLMDAVQCARSWTTPSLRPRLAGSAYALIPMAAPGAFHPKICLLASKKRCVVFIGSHNLTLSGFGFNREVTTYIDVRPDSDPAHKLLLSHVWSLLQEWLRTQDKVLAPSVLEAAHRIGELIPKADGAQSKHLDIRLLGQSSSEPSLLEQLDRAIPAAPRRVVVAGAFFDTQHAFLKALEARWPGASIKVIIDPKTVKLGGSPKGLRSQFVDARKLWEKNADRYLHAKALLLDFGDSHMLVAGSANPSRPAWLGGPRANFEAMLVRPNLEVASSGFARDLAQGFTARAMDDADLRSIPITHQDDENDADAPSAPIRIVALAPGTSAVLIPASDSVGFAEFIMHLQDGSHTAPAGLGRSEDGRAIVELGERAPEVRWLELSGRGGKLLRLIVHHDAALGRGAARSHRVALQDALAGLDFSGANIELLLQQIEKAIFDDPEQVVSPPPGTARPSAGEQAATASARPASLAVHVGEGVSAQKSKKKRLLQAGSLLDVLDALLYRLGQSLPRSASSGTNTPQLSEEELVGTEHEGASQEPPAALTQQAVNAVRKRIKQVVRRMIKQLKAAQDETRPEVRATKARTGVVQLVAVLSLVREFRRLRHQPQWRRMGGFIDSEIRQELLSQSMITLFGRARGIARDIRVHDVEIDEVVELGQVRALLAWLAWDIGYSLLKRIEPMAPKATKDDLVLAYAYLYDLLPAIATDDEDTAQLTSSVRMTSTPTADESAHGETWLAHHIATGLEVATAPAVAYLDREGIKAGDLIHVPHSSPPRFSVVVDVTAQDICLSELDVDRRFMRFAWRTTSTARCTPGN
ncbi:phospholipase D-like domain-containing protein [Burkholderia gladioli]|uniref:phospholipase D-like domain-containing protein n=1 Tax=Burkholderia gladioli TaxID=28095 RepID=UPI0016421C0F|nr:phospholipase D-like domain-containing protein [Burkholderia gladioli]